MAIPQLRSTLPYFTQQVSASVRNGLRERRRAGSDRRQLKRELASYTGRAEVDDLLASLSREDEACATEIRTLVARNLRTNH